LLSKAEDCKKVREGGVLWLFKVLKEKKGKVVDGSNSVFFILDCSLSILYFSLLSFGILVGEGGFSP
jgi:hypothetical protein